jgi:signal transduction histidine kinase
MKEGLANQEHAIAVTYFNITNVYTEQEDYPHALDYLFKAKQVDEKLKDTASILFDFYSLGSIYARMKKVDSALYYIHRSDRIARQTKDKNMLGAIMNTMGEIYASINNYPLAIKYYYLSIPYAKDIKDYGVLASDYYGIAKIFKQKGMLDSAVFYSKKALYISQEAPFHKQVLENSAFLTDVFKSKNQFDSAFKYQELSIATKDSLFNVENLKKVQNLKLLEQQRQQSIETAKIKYQNKVKLGIVISASGVFLLIALLLWRNNKQKQKSNALLQQEKEKVESTLEELKVTQAQLIHSEKMASLGELTAGIAHEIQNPLNFVNNFSQVNTELLEEMEQSLEAGNIEDALACATDIKENEKKVLYHGQRADSIVKGMLEHSRASTGEKKPTDINALANEYLNLSYHGLRAKDKEFQAKLLADYDPGIGKVNVAPQELGRVFLNLYNNAFYAIQQKKIQLNGQYQPEIKVSTRRMDRKVEIRVKDNGNGIPENVRSKIFQPFFTSKPAGQGTGLGLSLSYDIITKGHGGELKVETKEGEFSEFIINLPAEG